MIRVSALALRVAGSYEYKEVIFDTLQYFVLTKVFPLLIKLTLDVINNIAKKIAYIPLPESKHVFQEFIQKLFPEFVVMKILSLIGDVFLMGLSQSFYTVCMAMLIAIAPILLFLSTMLGVSAGMGPFFKAFISFGIAPVFCNLFGVLGRELWPYVNTFSRKCRDVLDCYFFSYRFFLQFIAGCCSIPCRQQPLLRK